MSKTFGASRNAPNTPLHVLSEVWTDDGVRHRYPIPFFPTKSSASVAISAPRLVLKVGALSQEMRWRILANFG